MIKSFIVIVALLFPLNALAQTLDFQIFSTNKGKSYRSTTFQSELEKQYGFLLAGATVWLVETPSFQDENYKEQNNIFESFGHEIEDLQLIYVISCTTEEYIDGYYTTIKAAKKLNPDNKFRVRLLSMNGTVLHESHSPLSKAELKEVLNKTRKNS